MNQLSSIYPFFTNRLGSALESGRIYIGQPDQNPITSPITVYWDRQCTQPAAQPLLTTAGYIARAGTQTDVYINATNYSIIVLDSSGRQVFYKKSVIADTLTLLGDGSLENGDALVSVKRPGSNIARTQHDRNINFLTTRDYCLCNGSNESSAFQLAVNDAIQNNCPLYIDGPVLCASTITATGNFTLIGSSTELSEITFTNNAGLQYTSSNVSEWNADQVTIKDVGFRVVGKSTSSVLSFSFVGGVGGTNRSVILDNIEITSADIGGGFNIGIDLNNARNITINDVRILGDRDASPITSMYGIKVLGDDSPVEIFVSKYRAYFLDTALYIGGKTEGVYINHSAIVACHHGINWDDSEVKPLLSVSNCHINTDKAAIMSSTLAQAFIHDNLFYFQHVDSTSTNYVGVQLSMNNAAVFDDSIVHHNVFMGIDSGIPKNAIVVSGLGNNKLLIQGNIFNGYDTAVWLTPTADRVRVSDDNIFYSCTTQVVDQGAGNLVAVSNVGSTGSKTNLDGLFEKWGSSVITTNSNGDFVIVFTQPFPNAFDHGIVCSGDQNAAGGGNNFIINQQACTSGGLAGSIRPNPGAVTVRVNWLAKGH